MVKLAACSRQHSQPPVSRCLHQGGGRGVEGVSPGAVCDPSHLLLGNRLPASRQIPGQPESLIICRNHHCSGTNVTESRPCRPTNPVTTPNQIFTLISRLTAEPICNNNPPPNRNPSTADHEASTPPPLSTLISSHPLAGGPLPPGGCAAPAVLTPCRLTSPGPARGEPAKSKRSRWKAARFAAARVSTKHPSAQSAGVRRSAPSRRSLPIYPETTPA